GLADTVGRALCLQDPALDPPKRHIIGIARRSAPSLTANGRLTQPVAQLRGAPRIDSPAPRQRATLGPRCGGGRSGARRAVRLECSRPSPFRSQPRPRCRDPLPRCEARPRQRARPDELLGLPDIALPNLANLRVKRRIHPWPSYTAGLTTRSDMSRRKFASHSATRASTSPVFSAS